MGWKWEFGDIAAGVDELVKAARQQLADALTARAVTEDGLARSTGSGQDSSYHKGRASAFREVVDGVKPK